MSSEVDIKNQKRRNQNAPQGNTSNPEPPTGRIRRERSENRGVCDYAEMDPGLVLRVLCAITARGCAVQFGYTRDGGAYAIRIVGDGEPYTEFIKPTEDVRLALSGLAEDFEL